MTTRIGINGLGRVGRALLRQAVLSEDLEVVGVNDLADARTLRTLLRRDSTFGPFPGEVEVGDDSPGHRRTQDPRVPTPSTPAELPWGELAVDVAVECTGKFRTADTAGGHLEAGARKVVISAPGKGVDATIVMGVNDEDLRPGAPRRRLQRVVHDQLRRADGQGAARRVRDPARLHDHGPRLHRRPEPARRPAQGPPPRAVGSGEHHPDHHRRGEGGRPGPPRAGRHASTASPCACRSWTARSSTWRCCSTATSPSTRSTPRSKPPPRSARARRPAPLRGRAVRLRATSSVTRPPASSTPR